MTPAVNEFGQWLVFLIAADAPLTMLDIADAPLQAWPWQSLIMTYDYLKGLRYVDLSSHQSVFLAYK